MVGVSTFAVMSTRATPFLTSFALSLAVILARGIWNLIVFFEIISIDCSMSGDVDGAFHTYGSPLVPAPVTVPPSTFTRVAGA